MTVLPQDRSYLHRIHRDVGSYAGSFRLLLNMLVMVDAFTMENGATHILSGSHLSRDRPPDDIFWRHAERIVGPAGSIVFFDSNVWHAAGVNVGDRRRSALTLSFSRPFCMKSKPGAWFATAEQIARYVKAQSKSDGFSILGRPKAIPDYRP